MAFDLTTITSDRIVRPPRIVLLGVEKIGKSTFAGDSEKPIFLPIKGEEGIDDIEAGKTPVCNSIGDVFGWLSSLFEGEHDYRTVAIDSGSTLESLIHEDVCSRLGGEQNIVLTGGGYGAGYGEALITWRTITQWLDALRSAKSMASIIIGHVKVKPFHDPGGGSYDQYQWDIHDKAANLLFRWADSILFANAKVVIRQEDTGFNKTRSRGIEIEENSRWLYTQKRPAHPGGGRGVYGHLPYELPLSFAHFQDAVAAQMQAPDTLGNRDLQPSQVKDTTND